MKKIILTCILSLILLFAIIPLSSLASSNPYPDSSQCTWHAWQKAYNMSGLSLPKWGNGSQWFAGAQNTGYRTVGPYEVPPANSIACWSGAPNGYGHVGYVINSDVNGVNIYEGNYAGTVRTHFQSYNTLRTRTPGQYLQGYIVLEDRMIVNLGDSFYAHIINTASWLHASNEPNKNVVGRVNNGALNLVWKFDRLSDGSYKITSALDGRCLEVNNFETHAGANIQTCPYSANSAQQWYIYGESAKYILKAKCTDCVLDFQGASHADGTNIQAWTRNQTEAQNIQIWKLDNDRANLSGAVNGRTVTFNWTKDIKANQYHLKIWKNEIWKGDAYAVIGDLYGLQTGYDFEPGVYQAYVDGINSVTGYYLMSNVITFTVY